MSDAQSVEVIRSRTRHRFEITVDGHVAGFAAYRLMEGGVDITHTEIEDAFSGQGLGSRLVREALEQLAAQGLAVKPTCPFVAEYLRRHHIAGLTVAGQQPGEVVPDVGGLESDGGSAGQEAADGDGQGGVDGPAGEAVPGAGNRDSAGEPVVPDAGGLESDGGSAGRDGWEAPGQADVEATEGEAVPGAGNPDSAGEQATPGTGLRAGEGSAVDEVPPAGATASGPVLLPHRVVPLGGLRGIEVHRSLPQRALPTVGAWCFLDRFAPTRTPMRVDPHPHTGLQTVTYLYAGSLRHRDSLGSDIVIEPGAVNLMTAGRGVAHSEYSLTSSGEIPEAGQELDEEATGVQLWIALPDRVRDLDPAFAHHDDLPVVAVDDATVRVLVGQLGDVTSPVGVYSALVGLDVELRGGEASLPVTPGFEYAVLVTQGQMEINGVQVGQDTLAWLDLGPAQLRISSAHKARALVLGGEPLGEDLVMWWNFVARSHDEIAAQRAAWEEGAAVFGQVPGHQGARIPAPPMPQVRLAPRRRAARP